MSNIPPHTRVLRQDGMGVSFLRPRWQQPAFRSNGYGTPQAPQDDTIIPPTFWLRS